MARIGVTGATGFIGGALVPALAAAGFSLVLVDDRSGPMVVEHPAHPAEAIRFDSPRALELLAGCDAVLHLAAVSGVMPCARDPAGTRRVNVDATRELLERCGARGVPVAFASSFAVVGKPERLPVNGATPARPTHEYARQKAEGEALVAAASRRFGTANAILRMSNVFGSYRVGGRAIAKGNVIAVFLAQAATGVLSVNAPGTQRRDFIHLDDVVAHWVAVADLLSRSPPPGAPTFVVGSGEAHSVLEIAAEIARDWTEAHPHDPVPEIRIVPNPREGVELVDPEFAVDRRETEERLGVRCRRHVAETIRGELGLPAAPA